MFQDVLPFCLRSFYDWHHEGVSTCMNVLLESCAGDIFVYNLPVVPHEAVAEVSK